MQDRPYCGTYLTTVSLSSVNGDNLTPPTAEVLANATGSVSVYVTTTVTTPFGTNHLKITVTRSTDTSQFIETELSVQIT